MTLIVEHGNIKILREGEPVKNVVFILRYKDEFKRQIWMRQVSQENYADKEKFALRNLIKDSIEFSDDKKEIEDLNNIYNHLFKYPS